MKITIHVRDEGGWPIMTVDQPVLESGDRGLRIIDFANRRHAELDVLCRKQRELTKEAKAGKAIRSPSGFMALWKQAMEEQT